MLKRFAIVALLCVPGAALAQPNAAISAGKAREIGCAAIQARYPKDGYKCSDFSVMLMSPGSDWAGNWSIYKTTPPSKSGESPNAIVSRKTGEVLHVGDYAM